MARILSIGIATLDIINEVNDYPQEDEEIRIIEQSCRRGGNAANTAVILSQLAHQTDWAGCLVNEADCQMINDDFQRYGVNYQYAQVLQQGKLPTSYIILSQTTGSRTICHYRDLPEFDFMAFRKINLDDFDWVHFEGRNVVQVHKMMLYVQQNFPHITVSVELEKARDNIECLLELAQVIFFSRHYIRSQGFDGAQAFCQSKSIEFFNKRIFCAWGSCGAAAFAEQKYFWQDAFAVKALDTLAAGDVFNAVIIDQLINKKCIKQALERACQIAAQSCSHKGLELNNDVVL